jgi:hypothetical protein
MTTCGSIFSSGGGWEYGAATFRSVWAAEDDSTLAAIHHANVGLVYRACPDRVCVSRLDKVDVLFVGARRAAAQDVQIGVYAKALEPKAICIESIGRLSADFRRVDAFLRQMKYTPHLFALDGKDTGTAVHRPRVYAVYTAEGSSFRVPAAVKPMPWTKAIGQVQLPLATGVSKAGLAMIPAQKWPIVMGRAASPFLGPDAVLPPMPIGLRVVDENGRANAITPEAMARMLGFRANYAMPADPAAARHVLTHVTAPVTARAIVGGLTLSR